MTAATRSASLRSAPVGNGGGTDTQTDELQTGHRPEALAHLRAQPILFLSEARAFGGHEQMAVLAAALLSRHAAVVFCCFAGNQRLRAAIEAENLRGAAVAIELSPVCDARLNPLLSFFRWSSIAEVRRYLRRQPYAVRVLVQGRIESGSVALLAARLGGVRLVSYLPMAHRLTDMRVRLLPRLRDRVNAFYYRLPDRYVTISEEVRRQLRRFAPQAAARVVENWIAPPAPLPPGADQASLRERWGLPRQVKVVAIIGRVDFQQKGHDVLVRALGCDAGRTSDFVVCVVGDGPDLQRLRRLVEAAGLAARFIFVPWIAGGMDRIYGSVDAVVVPSLYEGVPLVMLEALARGIPVAGSNVDGMADWLPAGATAPCDDVAALIGAIGFACGMHGDAYATAFARALRLTDKDAYVRAWIEALADCAARPPA